MPALPTAGSRRPTIAAIVPATDGAPSLAGCLAAIEAGARRPDEVIVVRDPAGSGPAAARNLGARRAAAEVLVFVDSDVEVHEDALGRIERHFLDPDLVAVFGAYDDDPAAPGLTSRFRNLLHHHVHVEAAGEAETFWAGLGAVRRTDFLAARGFDAERYPAPSIEDIELGMRLHAGGGRLLLDPAIRGRHLKAWTPLTMVRTDFSARGVPWARLVLAEGSGRGALNLSWRNRVSALASALIALSLLLRRPRLALAALIAVLGLNRGLYGLLARRGGPRLLVAGIGLHLVHQLTAVAAMVAALGQHFRRRERT